MSPARPTLLRHALRASGSGLALGALAALSQVGCYFTDEGLSPPSRAFYYPTGLATSPGRSALYVANSDFDLQYNGGTVQVLDLVTTRRTLHDLLAGIRCVQGSAEGCDAFVASGRTKPGAGDVASMCSQLRVGEGGAPLQANGNQILTPSACSPMAPPFAGGGATFATIGAFASGAVVAQHSGPATCSVTQRTCQTHADCTADPSDPPGQRCELRRSARLFVPVRGDPSITWFDVADDSEGAPSSADVDVQGATAASTLDCGQAPADVDSERRCSQDHRMGVDPFDNLRTTTLPVEPVGLDVSEDGTVVVSAHQIASGPAVGLSLNTWPRFCPPGETCRGTAPNFEFSLTSSVPAGPQEVARIPVPGYVAARQKASPTFGYQPGFLVTYNATAEVDLYRYDDDAQGSPPKPFITRAAVTGVGTNADGKDSRGVAIDATARQACEAACGASALACLSDCVKIPLDVFVANRAPPSLLLGRVRTTIVDSGSSGAGSAFDIPEIYDVVSLALGPSKVAIGHIIGLDGAPHPRVFAVTFDSSFIYSYDPVARRVDTVIRTGRGPHAITFDTGSDDDGMHAYLYVGHFTDSYLGVVDLDMRHPETFGIMFASIGTPTEPRESK